MAKPVSRLVAEKDKKDRERTILKGFLFTYYMKCGTQLRIVGASEKPDFICQDLATGEKMGVELCELLFETDRKKQAALDAITVAVRKEMKEKTTISWEKVWLEIHLKRIPRAKERQALAIAVIAYIEKLLRRQKLTRKRELTRLREFSDPVLKEFIKELGVEIYRGPRGPFMWVHHKILTHQKDEETSLLLDRLTKKKIRSVKYAKEHPNILVLYVEREPLLISLLDDRLAQHFVQPWIERHGLRDTFKRIYIFYVAPPMIVEL